MPRVRGRALASPLAAIALVTSIAACGGSSGRPVVHARASSSAVDAPSPVATAGRACTAADLSTVFLGQNDATGNVVLSFALRNHGSATCHTYGWPGIEFIGTGGRPLPTKSRRVTRDVLGSAPASVIALPPGMWASFRIVATDQNSSGGSAGCETAHSLQIVTPDDGGTMSIGIPGGAYECMVTTVSALQPGDTAAR